MMVEMTRLPPLGDLSQWRGTSSHPSLLRARLPHVTPAFAWSSRVGVETLPPVATLVPIAERIPMWQAMAGQAPRTCENALRGSSTASILCCLTTPPKRHDNEIPVDEALARRLLRAQFPEFADLPLRTHHEHGTDHTLFR